MDNTIHTALDEIATTQAKPTQKIKESTNTCMDYVHTHTDSKIRYE